MRGLDKVGLELVLDNLVCSISLEITVLLILRSEARGVYNFLLEEQSSSFKDMVLFSKPRTF